MPTNALTSMMQQIRLVFLSRTPAQNTNMQLHQVISGVPQTTGQTGRKSPHRVCPGLLVFAAAATEYQTRHSGQPGPTARSIYLKPMEIPGLRLQQPASRQ